MYLVLCFSESSGTRGQPCLSTRGRSTAGPSFAQLNPNFKGNPFLQMGLMASGLHETGRAQEQFHNKDPAKGDNDCCEEAFGDDNDPNYDAEGSYIAYFYISHKNMVSRRLTL